MTIYFGKCLGLAGFYINIYMVEEESPEKAVYAKQNIAPRASDQSQGKNLLEKTEREEEDV